MSIWIVQTAKRTFTVRARDIFEALDSFAEHFGPLIEGNNYTTRSGRPIDITKLRIFEL